MSLNQFLGSTGTKQGSPPRRHLTKKVALAVAGGLVLATADMLAPGAAQAIDLVSAPTVSGDPILASVTAGYSWAFTVTGAPAPTCAVTSGSLPPGLSLGASDCRLSGLATAGGSYPFTVTATNGTAPDAVWPTTITVNQPIGLTDQSLPILTVGQPVSYRLPLAGFPTPSVSWFNVGDPLPSGLILDADGLLHGTPTRAVTDSSVWLEVSNGTDTQYYGLHFAVEPAHTQITNTPPAATAGTFYEFTLATENFQSKPTFTVESGTLPSGIGFFANGRLAGTPQQATPGTAVTVRASNGVDPDALLTFTVPVSGSALTLTGTPPSPVTVGPQVLFTYGLTGIPRPSTAVTDGALPPGLTLDDEGLLNGWPTTPGMYTFTVTASNGGISPDVSITSTIVVGTGAGISGNPPVSTVGQPYSFAFTLAGSPVPTVQLSGGALPDGLTLSPNGVLSGTPTKAGGFTVTLLADNGVTQVTSTRTLSVHAATPPPTATPTVTIADTSRAEGNSGTSGVTFTITLSRPSASPVTVHWYTANGTAKAGSDYYGSSGTVTFAAGQTVKTVTVRVKGDRLREPTETFHVRLSSPHGATVSDGDALGRIINDD